MPKYLATYRYRENGILKTSQTIIESKHKLNAKRTAKNMEGQSGKTWLIDIVGK